ncbi:MAG: hypothetical protein ACYTFK_14310 [Planctomycetota bacterium]|jgi:hypothetical protein
MKKIYIICAVRKATVSTRAALEAYTDILEDAGHKVHLPHRNTKQDGNGMEINMENGAAIVNADEVHVFWDNTSSGSHFDLGMTFMLDMLLGHKKRVRMIQYGGVGMSAGADEYGSFIASWVKEQEDTNLYDRCLDDTIFTNIR